MYAPNDKAAKYMKHILIELKRQIDKFIVIVRKFNVTLSTTNKTHTKEICNGMEEINNTLNQQNLTGIYITLQATV